MRIIFHSSIEMCPCVRACVRVCFHNSTGATASHSTIELMHNNKSRFIYLVASLFLHLLPPAIVHSHTTQTNETSVFVFFCSAALNFPFPFDRLLFMKAPYNFHINTSADDLCEHICSSSRQSRSPKLWKIRILHTQDTAKQ